MNGEKIRVALCVDSTYVSAWVRELVNRLMTSDAVTIALLIDTRSNSPEPLPALGSAGTHLLYNLLRGIERRIFRPARNAFALADVSGTLAHVPMVHFDPETASGDTVQEIADHHPDLVLTFSRHVLPDSLIALPPYGIWSYKTRFQLENPHFLDGFWEVIEGIPVTNSALYRLTTGTSADIVICQSVSATDKSFVMRNLNSVCWKSVHFVERALRDVPERRENIPPFHAHANHAPVARHTLLKDPTNRALLFPLLTHLTRMLSRRLKGLLYRRQWVLAFKSALSGRSSFRTVLPQGDGVWADPHIFVRDNRRHVFIEEIPHGSRTGRIAVFEMNDDEKVQMPRPVLERPYHLSYPFVFEWQGGIYMIPQSTGQQAIELYRCISFPDSWEFDKHLVRGIDAVDSTLVQRHGRWWLFTCTRDNSGYSPSEELCIFHADSPISDQWIPHRRNPVISDVRRARPAGAFIERENHLYRPSQDCSIRYGYGTRINRVEILNEREYVEREVSFIEPKWDPRVKGVHSIAVNQTLTVIDALLEQPKFFRLRPSR